MNDHRAAVRIVWIGLVLFLFAGSVAAQEKSGTLHGTIFDDTGAVLPGATVTLTNKSTHRIVETSSGAYGDYTVRDIPPGQYSILVTLPGFTGTEFPNLAILVAQNLRLAQHTASLVFPFWPGDGLFWSISRRMFSSNSSLLMMPRSALEAAASSVPKIVLT